MRDSAEDRVVRPQPVHKLCTGRRGRPALVIDPAFLRDAVSDHRRIPQTVLAKALGIHRNTLRQKLKAQNLERRYSTISDEDLDTLVRGFKEIKPRSGLRYFTGFLKANGLRIQKERVRLALHRVDGLNQTLRNHAAIDRRVYDVPRPNFLWHIDGHHKLIRWGVVLHGGVDGFCRTVRHVATYPFRR